MNGELVVDLIVEAAWKSVIVAGAALLLVALFRNRSAAERACVAHFGMAALLLLPVLVVMGPSLELLPAREAAPAATVQETPVLAQPDGEMASAAAVQPAAAAASEPWLDAGTALTWGYGLPAGLLLLLTIVAILRLFALRGRASVIVQQGWLSALAHAQRRMGIKSGTALLVSEELTSPVSWGIMRPVILLNEEALESAEDAEAIIAHELAHVAHFDWLNLLAARLATALFWFNPLVWLLARLGHQLREEAADDAVLRAEVPNTEYAALLVGAARHEGKGLLLAAHGVAPSKGSLAMRVHRILEPTMSRTPARLVWAAGSAAAMVAVAAPLAALTPAQAPIAPIAPSAPSAQFAQSAPIAPPAPVAAAAPAAPPVPAAPPAPLAPAAAPAPAMAAPPSAPPAPVAAPIASAQVAATAVASAAIAAPITPGPPIPPDTLVALRIHGITGEEAQAYTSAYPRLRNLSIDQLVSFQVHGVRASRLREYAALGYTDLSADRIIEWAVHGVSPRFIRELGDAGYRNISPSKLTEFRIFGVTGDFVRRVQSSGIGAVSPERIVEMRILGTGPRGPSRPRTAPPPRRGPHPPHPSG